MNDKNRDLAVLATVAEHNANLEAGFMADAGGMFPDWVYHARRCRQIAESKLTWLDELLRALGWQAGTIHQALSAVARLAAVAREQESKETGSNA